MDEKADLPRFIDRWTIEYVRVYPHPMARVWSAITDPKEFGAWFIRGRLDLRKGGAYEFETGDNGFKGVVLDVDAPRRIRFGGPTDETGYFEYELTETKGGTRMRFVQHFPPNGAYAGTADDSGGDLPAGPDTPWKPGFVGGWHEFFDALGDFLDGVPIGSRTPETDFTRLTEGWARMAVRLGEFTDKQVAVVALSLRRHERWDSLNRFYRVYIREHCPRA
jgi:uncharacterized protein YndB with AHSA1/START domain